MAYHTKETYERKAEWAANRMEENSKIESLTEEQHSALAKLCSFRHELHCNQDSLFITESANYNKYHEMLDEGVNTILINAGLLIINGIATDFMPSDMDLAYGCAEEWETLEEGKEIALNQAIAINEKIETYLLQIDNKYGTNYCPSGKSRL